MSKRSRGDYTPAPRNATSTQQVTPEDKKRFRSVDRIVLRILSDNLPHTNHELSAATNGARVNSIITRLRWRDGYRIKTDRVGRSTFTYRLQDVLDKKERDAL